MEVEVGNGKIQDVVLGPEPELGAQLQDDLRVLLAVHAVRGHRLQHVNRLLDACLELFEGGLIVGHGDDVHVGDAGDAVFGVVADGLDLIGQGEHVFDQAGFDQFGRRDVPASGGVSDLFVSDVSRGWRSPTVPRRRLSPWRE